MEMTVKHLGPDIELEDRGHQLRMRDFRTGEPRPIDATYIFVPGLDSQIPDPVSVYSGLHNTCAMCGEHARYVLINGKIASNTKFCKFPEGEDTVSVIYVPSGKIVVDDNLRETVDIEEDSFVTYNSALGQAQVIKAYADIGVAYGPVQNTSPSLYRTGEGTYVIANPGWDYDDNRDPGNEFGERLANVCTDLWAYSIMDHDAFVGLGGDPHLSWTRSVVEVPAGHYRFTHHTTRRDFDYDAEGPMIFAHMELMPDDTYAAS